MSDLRSELPPAVDVDSLSTEARKELKEHIDHYGSLNDIPRFEVEHPEVMVVYLQANFNPNEILMFLLEQRNRVKQYLLEEEGYEAYENAPPDVNFDNMMAADIFVDDMRVLNRYNQFFGEIHSILDDVEEEHDEETVEKVREKLKDRFPEDSEELREALDDPFPLPEKED